jgi:membrane fusion protein (multidrug efflux system)
METNPAGNPKPEGRRPKEGRNPKAEESRPPQSTHNSRKKSASRILVPSIRISVFGLLSAFGLRVSDLNTALAFAFVGIILSGCDRTEPAAATRQSAPVEVQVVQPRRGPIVRYVTLPAEIRAYQQATLYAKVPGYLKAISVDKGDQAKEGALLAEIEVPELLADRAKYNAEVEIAAIDYQRLSESQKKAPDLVVPQTVDDARGKLDIAKANLERTETLLNYAKIVAPFSGVITRRMVDPGAFIPAATSGSAAQNAAIVTLTDFNRVRVQVAVPEVEASHVEVGEPIKMMVEGLPGRTFAGTVTRFSYALEEATKTMLAEIELPNPNLELRPGMYATVKIGIERKEDALLVPVDAVFTEKAGASVFILVENKAKKNRVQTGFSDGMQVEIASGVQPNQQVILPGKRTLSDGQPVKISESK